MTLEIIIAIEILQNIVRKRLWYVAVVLESNSSTLRIKFRYRSAYKYCQ